MIIALYIYMYTYIRICIMYLWSFHFGRQPWACHYVPCERPPRHKCIICKYCNCIICIVYIRGFHLGRQPWACHYVTCKRWPVSFARERGWILIQWTDIPTEIHSKPCYSLLWAWLGRSKRVMCQLLVGESSARSLQSFHSYPKIPKFWLSQPSIITSLRLASGSTGKISP